MKRLAINNSMIKLKIQHIFSKNIAILSFELLIFSIANIANAQVTGIPTDDKAMLINESTINSPNLEYSPTFYENGIVFISTDNKTHSKIIDQNQKNFKGVSIQIARRGPEGILTAPELFSKKMTSSYNDGPLCFDAENKTVFYSTNNSKKVKSKSGKRCQRILMMNYQNNEWGTPIDLPFNNDEFDNCHPTISIDGNTLYFASNRERGVGGMDLYYVKKEGDSWGTPINLGPEVNTNKNDAFPYIHPNGTLFFASDGREGLGGLDIYYTKMQENEQFSAPQNLGKPYNSEADDFGFIVDIDAKNGYLSSNRTGGNGEDDIYSFTTQNIVAKPVEVIKECTIVLFTAEKTDGKEIDNVNIKVANISDYEIGEVISDNAGNIIKLTAVDSTNILTSVGDGSAIKYTSNAEGRAEVKVKNGKYLVNLTKNGYQNKEVLINGCEDRDEMLVLLEKIGDNTIPLVGNLKNNRGNPIANATVTLTDEASGETQTITTDNQGNYKYNVKPDANYKVSVVKDNYLAASTKISTKDMKKDSKPVPVNIEMAELTNPLPAGKVFQLNNVYYNFNDAALRPDARLDLDPLVSLLKSYPEVEIELSSHTDSRGDKNYNQTLSQKRAESAVKYLTDRGIAANRIKAVGYGEAQPRNRCVDGVKCSEVEHKINRRTEVKITKGGNELDVAIIDKLYSNKNSESSSTDSNSTNPNGNAANNSGSSSSAIVNGEYWVVAGSYQNPKNAEDQLASLTRKGYTPTIVFASDINFYRVLVEKTNSLEVARTILRKLKSQREPAFVLRG